jgi:hypothetical protein
MQELTLLRATETSRPSNKRPIQIGYTKTCQCPPNHLNCMTAKEWIKSQLGVWHFNYEGRDIRDKNQHPATFPISLAKKLLNCSHIRENWLSIHLLEVEQHW